VATSPLVPRSLPAPLRSAGAAGGLRPLARHRHVRHRAPQDDRSLWADEGLLNVIEDEKLGVTLAAAVR